MTSAKRSAVNLTDFKVNSLKPDPAGEYLQGDTQVPGFGVRVRPDGTATYVVMKRLPRRGQTDARYPRAGEISLADAREEARNKIAAVRRGVDVNAEKRRALEHRRSRRAAAEQVRAETGYEPATFGELAVRYIARECRRLARGAEIERLVRRELLPPLGNRPIAELRRRELGDVIDAILDSGRPALAHKVREVGKRITSSAEAEEFIERDPFVGGKSPVRRAARTRALAAAEIVALRQAWETISAPLGLYMMFALAAAQRLREIVGPPSANIVKLHARA